MMQLSKYLQRPDTIFGVTFMTLAPEHELVTKSPLQNKKQRLMLTLKLLQNVRKEKEWQMLKPFQEFSLERMLNILSQRTNSVWIGDYVLAGYGTGAVMAVPCGDERDYAFANFFKGTTECQQLKIFSIKIFPEAALRRKGGFELVNSDFLNGLDYKSGTKKLSKN